MDYDLEPMPPVHSPLPENSVPMGDVATFAEEKLDLPVTPGPYEPTWSSIEANYPGTPQWLRDAKFGIWVHFGPQSAGESGDWYARKLYVQGTLAYENHLKRYGHPSKVGYKEVLRDWNPEKFSPAALVDLYRDAGARFLIIQGVHHDQFDMWDSKYQQWNSTRLARSVISCASGRRRRVMPICVSASPSITNIHGGGRRPSRATLRATWRVYPTTAT